MQTWVEDIEKSHTAKVKNINYPYFLVLSEGIRNLSEPSNKRYPFFIILSLESTLIKYLKFLVDETPAAFLVLKK